MRYYEVYVSESSYQQAGPLTYQSESALGNGCIVEVPYGRKTVAGFIYKESEKPNFKCRSVIRELEFKPLPDKLIALHEWMLEYYPYGAGPTTQAFLPSGLTGNISNIDPAKPTQVDLPKLTDEQVSALDTISRSDSKSFIIHGETGSGKTRLYTELAANCLGLGKSVLVLVPEISLIPQIKSEIELGLGVYVVDIHSDLTKTQKLKNWKLINQSDSPQVVIGTRSALFSPIENLGLIVIDEVHEPTYKQDSSPRYNALRAAAHLSRIHDSLITYGSATPPIVEYYIGQITKTPIIRLEKPAKTQLTVKRQIIDMKNRKSFSRHPQISDDLIKALEIRLKINQQSMLFLNRRGTARQILCQDCGWQALCPKCDLPLTLHSDTNNVRCHTCGYSNTPPLNCPVCGSLDIKYRSIGTKSLVYDLEKIFPTAKIKRFDTDNSLSDSLAKNFTDIKSGDIDILVGTQMLGKGLDLPKLSLVGIINADTSLHMPDYSSTERSYQLLHQAIGRVGRGHVEGEIIVQTYNPDDEVLLSAVTRSFSICCFISIALF